MGSAVRLAYASTARPAARSAMPQGRAVGWGGRVCDPRCGVGARASGVPPRSPTGRRRCRVDGQGRAARRRRGAVRRQGVAAARSGPGRDGRAGRPPPGQAASADRSSRTVGCERGRPPRWTAEPWDSPGRGRRSAGGGRCRRDRWGPRPRPEAAVLAEPGARSRPARTRRSGRSILRGRLGRHAGVPRAEHECHRDGRGHRDQCQQGQGRRQREGLVGGQEVGRRAVERHARQVAAQVEEEEEGQHGAEQCRTGPS